MKRLLIATLSACLLIGAPGVRAEANRANFGVGVSVLAAHQPTLALALPLPAPGHLIRDDRHGRDYVYQGGIDTANAYYRAHMRSLGYRLTGERRIATDHVELEFQRGKELTLVSLRAAIGASPTRIGLRAMRR